MVDKRPRTEASHNSAVRQIAWFLGFIVICGGVSPLAAQEEPTTNAIVAAEDCADPLAGGAFGQAARPDAAPPTPEHTGIKAMIKGLGQDVINLPSRQNLLWVGVGTGLSLAVHPLDDHANEDLSGNTLNKVFAPGAIMGQSYTLLGVAAPSMPSAGSRTSRKSLIWAWT